MEQVKMKKLVFLMEHKLEIYFYRRSSIIYDISPKLGSARFRDLLDEEVFQTGKIEDFGRTIRWNEHTEISVQEILDSINKKNNEK